MRSRCAKHDCGFVLPNVLIYVGALSAIALALLGQLDRSIERIELSQSATQTGLVADAAVAFAIALLEDDATRSTGDHYEEAWALRDYRLETQGGDAMITVEDMQSRMNINLLVTDPAAANAFKAASQEVGVSASERIVGVFGGWIAPPGTNVEGRGGGAEFLPDDILQLAELAMVAGTTHADIAKLEDFATALPRDRRVNVNTAEPSLLAHALGMQAAQRLESARPISTAEAFRTEIDALQADLPGGVAEALTTVSSAWFCAKVFVRLGVVETKRNTVLHRDTDTGIVTVISHRSGMNQSGC